LKCRQRKKQWLTSLQAKVDWYTQENAALSSQVEQFKEEIATLKALLLAHKDCPVARRNGATSEMVSQAVGQAPVYGPAVNAGYR
jgi:ATF/CREB family transcription factor